MNRETSQTAENTDLQPLGPDSLIWDYLGEYRFFTVLSQAFVLQVAHPIISAGVDEHSTYMSDPWGRLERSVKLLWPVVYARPEEALQKAHELRDLHRAIKGKMPDGSRYHALDPEAYAWVHQTGFHAALRMFELFGEPLTDGQEEILFHEQYRMGRLLGLRDQDMPATRAEYWEYFNDMIDNRLEWTPVLANLLDEDFFHGQSRPSTNWLKLLPAPLWRLGLKPVADLTELLNRATLPERFREHFNVPFTAKDEARLKRTMKILRLAHNMTPKELRYLPMVRKVRRDARLHPDAFHAETFQASALQPG